MHFTSSLRKNPCSSVAPAAHQKPSSRTRSKSKESVKRPIRAHRLNPCFLIKARRMASVLLCALCGRPQASRMAILHSTFEGPIPHYKTTRLFAEAYTPNLRKSPLFRFPQSLSCFLLQDNQRYFLLPHDIAPRLQSLSNLRHKT